MTRIRKVVTASGKTAIQAVSREGLFRRTKVVKHFGSASNKAEIGRLLALAQKFLEGEEKTEPLFPELFESPKYDLVSRTHNETPRGKPTRYPLGIYV